MINFYQLFNKINENDLKEKYYTAYTAVTIHQLDKRRLIKKFKNYIPNEWETMADHMTINKGPAELGPAANMVGKTVELQVRSFGIDDKVAAVQVETKVPSENATKHITLAVNRAVATPKDSNKIQEWQPIEPFVVRGTIQEVQQKGMAPKPRKTVAPKQPAPNDPKKFLQMMQGKPTHVIKKAMKGKFPHMSDEEIENQLRSI